MLQGTVLGPILFNIHINDLFKQPSVGKIISFADDTAVFYKATSWSDLKRIVELDFVNIINFFNNKLLTMNFTKTQFLPLSDTLPTYNTLFFQTKQTTIEITG